MKETLFSEFTFSYLKSFELDTVNTAFGFLLHINSNFDDIYNLLPKIFTKFIVEPRRFFMKKN